MRLRRLVSSVCRAPTQQASRRPTCWPIVRMERELDLTAEQREPIDKVLKEGQERTKKLMETVEPRRREEFKKTMEDFRAVLTPEQRSRFDELVKRSEERAREQRKAAPPKEHLPKTTPAGNPPAATNT